MKKIENLKAYSADIYRDHVVFYGEEWAFPRFGSLVDRILDVQPHTYISNELEYRPSYSHEIAEYMNQKGIQDMLYFTKESILYLFMDTEIGVIVLPDVAGWSLEEKIYKYFKKVDKFPKVSRDMFQIRRKSLFNRNLIYYTENLKTMIGANTNAY